MDGKFSSAWIETCCKLIPGVQSAIFVMPNRANNSMRLLARWPLNLERHADLLDVVKCCLKKSEAICLPDAYRRDDQPCDFYALPVPVKSGAQGAIVVRVSHLPAAKQPAVINSLKRSLKWLSLAKINKNQDEAFYSEVVALLAACFEQGSYHQGLLKMVSELTAQFRCDRVAFAEFNQHHCRVIALSNSAGFDQRANLIKLIGDAMDEAVEQDNVIQYPQKGSRLINRAHQELARSYTAGSLCTIPLVNENGVFGAITLMNSEANRLDDKAVSLCQQTLSLMTPFLALKREQEKSFLALLGNRLGRTLKSLLGFKYLKLKLAAILIGAILITANLIEAEYRVSADAILEGKIQRVIAAPISGYLLSASVRAGDTVRRGEVMASLNDSDLKLELVRLNGQLQKSRREYRKAQSTRDLVNVRVIKEQINQANAEIELNQLQLEKIRLAAPFDGIVIEGDLSQLLGSPVERGDSLFKIAPLEGYRIILKVDESQISRIKVGQRGWLALSSLAADRLSLTVEKITAVAKAGNGANIFRVEASLDNAPELLRPGMQGVGKIDTGKAKLWWIWSHEIIDWLSLRLWSSWP